MYQSFMNRLKTPLIPTNFHLIVLGSSIEGLACAKEAVKYGIKVGVITNDSIWRSLEETTFLNLLHFGVKSVTNYDDAKSYGWKLGRVCSTDIRIEEIMKRTRNSVNQYCEENMSIYLDDRVHYITANVKFVSPNEVVDEEQNLSYQADYFLLAPFEYSSFPENIPGAKNYGLLPNDLLNVDTLSGEILIVGEKSSSLQLSSILLKMGYNITLLWRDKIAPSLDQQMIELFIESLISNGLKTMPKCVLHFIKKDDSGKRLYIEYTKLSKEWHGNAIFDKIIFVTNNESNIRELSTNEIGLKLFRHRIQTNDRYQTNIKHIYSFSNEFIKLFDKLTSIQIGKNLAKILFNNEQKIINDYDLTAFIPGEIDYCFVGLTEEDAILKYDFNNIEIYHSYIKPLEFSLPYKSIRQCYVKIICLYDDKILGMHILGPTASVCIQGYASALRCGLTKDQLFNDVGVFPTVGREFTQLKITKRSGENPSPTACCS